MNLTTEGRVQGGEQVNGGVKGETAEVHRGPSIKGDGEHPVESVRAQTDE